MLNLSKLKASADNNSCIEYMMITVLDKVEKHHGKRRKLWRPSFSPFSRMFSRGLLITVVKSHDCFGKCDLSRQKGPFWNS